jgi:hypothetical protein
VRRDRLLSGITTDNTDIITNTGIAISFINEGESGPYLIT